MKFFINIALCNVLIGYIINVMELGFDESAIAALVVIGVGAALLWTVADFLDNWFEKRSASKACK